MRRGQRIAVSKVETLAIIGQKDQIRAALSEVATGACSASGIIVAMLLCGKKLVGIINLMVFEHKVCFTFCVLDQNKIEPVRMHAATRGA